MSAPVSTDIQHPVATISRATSLAVAATAVVGNPWILEALREYRVNYADVVQTYMDEDFPATKAPHQIQIFFSTIRSLWAGAWNTRILSLSEVKNSCKAPARPSVP